MNVGKSQKVRWSAFPGNPKKKDIVIAQVIENLVTLYLFNSALLSNQSWTSAAEVKTLFTHRHSMNAFSEPLPSGTLDLVEAIKS